MKPKLTKAQEHLLEHFRKRADREPSNRNRWQGKTLKALFDAGLLVAGCRITEAGRKVCEGLK